MSTKGQGHSLTLAKGHSDFNFFSETEGWFETTVHMKISGRIGKKIYINELGHITKMAAFKDLAQIWNKPLKIVFSKTDWPMTLKLSM